MGWFIKFSVQTFQSLIESTEGITFCIILKDVQQFIEHCLIPLDLCNYLIINDFKDSFDVQSELTSTPRKQSVTSSFDNDQVIKDSGREGILDYKLY